MKTMNRIAITLMELLVVIAIIGVLISLLLPAVQKARSSARKTRTLSDLRQSGIGIHAYHDVHGCLPPTQAGIGWEKRIRPFLEDVKPTGCAFTGLGMMGTPNLTIPDVSRADGTSQTIMLATVTLGGGEAVQGMQYRADTPLLIRREWGVCFGDCNIRVFPRTVPEETVRALITWRGGETVELD